MTVRPSALKQSSAHPYFPLVSSIYLPIYLPTYLPGGWTGSKLCCSAELVAVLNWGAMIDELCCSGEMYCCAEWGAGVCVRVCVCVNCAHCWCVLFLSCVRRFGRPKDICAKWKVIRVIQAFQSCFRAKATTAQRIKGQIAAKRIQKVSFTRPDCALEASLARNFSSQNSREFIVWRLVNYSERRATLHVMHMCAAKRSYDLRGFPLCLVP